ncbi:MAG: lasso peptide biosynthesis protein [Gemmatimonadaceae bacterium]|nr:lasso peptide biosynthesis protein [Gemmatimonadaceae bacterium]MCW5826003.1 lasso peptide biosynthesis protein [Gemmatimonadaceae bacterium]
MSDRQQRAANRRRSRTIAAAVILVAWLGGLGALAAREFFRDRSVIIAEAAMRLGPSATYFVVEQGGRQIGFASTTIDTTGTTFDVIDYFIADLPIAGRSFRASARSVITMSRALALRRFDVQVDIPEAPMSAVGTVEGDSAVRFVLRMPGQPSDTQRVAVRGPILVPTMLPATAMLIGTPSVGKSVTLPSFDPRTMAASDVTFRIAAESLFTVTDSARFDAASNLFVSAHDTTVVAWKLEPTDGSGFSGWVDAQGNVVLAQQPGGIVLRRMAYEIAFENWRRTRGEDGAATGGSALGDLLEGTAIAADALPGNRVLSALRVRLTGTSLAGFDLAGGRQRLRGDTLEVSAEPASALAADWSLATRDRAFRERYRAYLQEEPLLQVNNREIVNLAVRIAGNERDPRVVAERINRWVHDSLAKEITLTVPSALQVLRARRGDCNEHTQLYVALARAAGIPARIATGLAYVNGKFYYHAWPEIRLGDWVAVDPTFGQFPADAAHLRFVSGGLTRQGELLRLVGTLQVEVLDAR